ncbi:MAG: MotA/TolQ/ExbB proton channel family protein [Rickettsiales bacterium]
MENASFWTLLAEKGGVVMLLLISLSVYTMAIILMKLAQFWRDGLLFGKAERAVHALLQGRPPRESVGFLPPRHPVRRVVEYAAGGKRSLNNVVAFGNGIFRRVDAHTGALEMIAGAAPLLGLLGTVVGMVKSFSVIGTQGASVDPSVLAGGIWEALLTTIAGLAVAIPSIVFSHIFASKAESARQAAADALGALPVAKEENGKAKKDDDELLIA